MPPGPPEIVRIEVRITITSHYSKTRTITEAFGPRSRPNGAESLRDDVRLFPLSLNMQLGGQMIVADFKAFLL